MVHTYINCTQMKSKKCSWKEKNALWQDALELELLLLQDTQETKENLSLRALRGFRHSTHRHQLQIPAGDKGK